MKKGNLWLERNLFMGGYLAFVTSQAEFVEALKEIKCTSCEDLFVPNGWPACTHTFSNVNGSIACVVALDMERAAKEDPIDVAALLVHEAVHVWQENEKACGTIGCFGHEGEAYSIQNISTRLMTAYAERL